MKVETVTVGKPRTMGERFKWVRYRAGLTVRGAQAASGVSFNTVARLENGDNIRMVSCVKLARAYGVSLDWLATGKGQP